MYVFCCCGCGVFFAALYVMKMGRWSECSVVIVFQVVRLLMVELAVVTSGEVGCCCALYGSLVGASVFSVM